MVVPCRRKSIGGNRPPLNHDLKIGFGEGHQARSSGGPGACSSRISRCSNGGRKTTPVRERRQSGELKAPECRGVYAHSARIPARRGEPFDDPAWAFELKLDIFRCIADTINGRLQSKHGNRMKPFDRLLETAAGVLLWGPLGLTSNLPFNPAVIAPITAPGVLAPCIVLAWAPFPIVGMDHCVSIGWIFVPLSRVPAHIPAADDSRRRARDRQAEYHDARSRA